MIIDDLLQAAPSALIVAGAAGLAWRVSGVRPLFLATLVVATSLITWPLVAVRFVEYADVFWLMRMLAWGGFVWGPTWLFIAGTFALRRGGRAVASLFFVPAIATAAFALEAFVREPTALVETRYVLVSSKVARPIRIAIVADYQTDNIGAYERDVAERVLAASPDLILLPGDYVQRWDESEYQRVAADFHAMMRDVDFAPPMGSYAVEGNMESVRPGRWMELFRDTRIQATAETRTWHSGEVSITALSFDDSFDTRLDVPDQPGFHIVVGHGPDYFLGSPHADLVVAGHTHGGQVQVPLFGPLLTLSRVPRAWAGGGLFQLPSGPFGVVSRGIGMERAYAPRMRFWCRPELVFVDVMPAS